MTVHKITKEEIDAFKALFTALELGMSEASFSLLCAAEAWEDLVDDDPTKVEILQMREQLCKEERLSKDDLDARILMYEWIKGKVAQVGWLGKLLFTADILLENVCDPTEEHLALYPGFELHHVAAEM